MGEKWSFDPFLGLFLYIMEYRQKSNFGPIFTLPRFTQINISRAHDKIFTFRKKRVKANKIIFYMRLTCIFDP